MNKKPIILIYVWCRAEAYFYLRFQNSANQLGYQIYYLTDKYSCYKYLSNNISLSNKAYFITKTKIRKTYPAYFAIDIEYRLHTFNLRQVQKIYDSCLNFLENFSFENIKYIFLWSGYRVIDHALKTYASSRGIKTLYFEIANIDGKLFVDPEGTNARSLLQRKSEILNFYEVDKQAFYDWRKEYIKSKFTQVTVKQAAHTPLLVAGKDYFNDIWGRVAKRGGSPIEFPLKRLYRRFFKTKFPELGVMLESGHYILFPLQVSTDTQVILNANCSLLEAVKRSIELARKKNVYLVIKPHPAEKNPTYIKQLLDVTSTYDKVIFSNENTFKLMKNALEVITINSTVGLEALILGCKVHIIGKAFYENFHTEDDIARYIMGYLLDVDYWGEKPLSTDILNKMLERAHLS